jgi:hypothetical protein
LGVYYFYRYWAASFWIMPLCLFEAGIKIILYHCSPDFDSAYFPDNPVR